MTPDDPFLTVPSPLANAMKRRGFSRLTPVQVAAANTLLAEDTAARNLRISSATGSGKTVALGIALSQTLLQQPLSTAQPCVLVITPTRELAVQVQSELGWLYEEVNQLRTEVVTGGTSVRAEQLRLRRHPQVLVGTPGRLLDHIRSGALSCQGISEVVLDEADQMLDMGFKDELDEIVLALPEVRRSHLVSATFPPAVERLAARFQGNGAHRLEGSQLGQANQDIQHLAYLIHPRDVYPALVNLLLEHWGERCLVFVQKRSDATELSESLARDGFSALPFSGDLAQAQRTRTLDAFRTGIIQTLIATDVAARGIDVPEITTVIHTDIPKEPDIYTHRSGRTGRAGKSGQSLILVPVHAQRYVERLLSRARVNVEWSPVPSAKKIRQRVSKATRRALYEQLSVGDLTEAELAYASQLIEKQPVAPLVATLLRMAEPKLPREPLDVATPAPRARSAHSFEKAGSRDGRYVRFVLNWGFQQGANPNRVLSHVCRRGGIGKESVGAIDVSRSSSSIEVSEAVAHDFERRVRKPDARDPHVKIMLDRAASENRETSFRRRQAPSGRFRAQDVAAKAPSGPRVRRAARKHRTSPSKTET